MSAMLGANSVGLLTEDSGGGVTSPDAGSDRDLLSRFVAGDHAAFAALVCRHGDMVLGVCRRLLSRADADDAFQATFMVLARRAANRNWGGSVVGWLHETARRTALKLRSSGNRRRAVENASAATRPDVAPQSADPGRAAAVRELAEILDAELDCLPEPFREVILLNQAQGISRQEIAEQLEISPSAVKDRLERGRQQLAARLSRRGITVSAAALAAWLVPGSGSASAATLAGTVTQTAAAFAAGTATAPGAIAATTLANGVLHMLGIQKLKTVAIALFTLLTAGSLALGMLRDDPKRFEKGMMGQVVSVTPGVGAAPTTLTVRLDEFEALLNLDVASDVKVWTAYESGGIADLHEGQFVSLRLGGDHRTINEIHVRGQRREVIVTAIDPTGAITATDAPNEDDDDEENANRPAPTPQQYQLAEGAIVRIGGLPGGIIDIKPGMRIPLELASGGKKVNAIEFNGDDTLMINGEVVTTGPATIKITPEQDEEAVEAAVERSLDVNADTAIIIDGKPGKLSDIKPKSDITVRIADDCSTARAIRATSPESDDEDDKENDK